MAEKQRWKRGTHYTPGERAFFANLVTQFKDIIEDKTPGMILKKRKRDVWKAIVEKYNSVSCTGPRDVLQLKTLYVNMKQKAEINYGESNKIECGKIISPVKNEDFSRTLKNLREDKVQINKSSGGFNKKKNVDGDSKIFAKIPEQVDPDSKPLRRGARYLKVLDTSDLSEPSRSKSPDVKIDFFDEDSNSSSSTSINVNQVTELNGQSGRPDPENPDAETRCEDSQMLSLTLEEDASVSRTNQPKLVKRKMATTKNTTNQTGAYLPNQNTRNTSAEGLKRKYLTKMCSNANLERKKLMLEIMQNKEQHRLKMFILKKKLENLS